MLGAPDGTMRELWHLAGPVIGSRLGIMAMGLTDAIVVGQYSAEQLGHHALGWAPTGTVLVAGIGLLVGVQVLTARHLGAGRPERTGAVLRRGIVYAFWLGVAFTFLIFAAGPSAMGLLAIDPVLRDGATAVMLIFALSMTPYLVADAMIFWLEAHGRAAWPLYAMWAANVVNLALDLWMVPGHSPFGVSGAEGAAWATLGSRTALMLLLAVMVLRWHRARDWGVFRKPPPDRAEAHEQRRIGYASGASYAIEAGAFSALSVVAALAGTLAVAAWAVVINVAAIVFMLPMGLATATAVFVSRSVGAGDAGAMVRAFRLGMANTVAVLLVVSLLMALGADGVARAYTADPRVLPAIASALVLASLFFVADGMQAVSAGSLRARGDIWWPTAMHVFSYLVLMLPLAWLLSHRLGGGLDGIVWAVILASLVSAATLTARFLLLGRRLPDPRALARAGAA
jgi:MATE family multidrug resistance protein